MGNKTDHIYDGMNTVERCLKRTIDFLIACLCLVFFSPLFLICYIAVRMEDKGPAIFKQERLSLIHISEPTRRSV